MLDYHARYYDAVVGRFISPDSVVPDYANPQDLNRYSYVRGNPVRFSDPSGHWLFEDAPDDPSIWYDKPDEFQDTLVRGRNADSFTNWEETQSPPTLKPITEIGPQLSYPDCARGTISFGYGGNVFGIVGPRGGGTINFDTYGNVSITAGGGGGGYAAAGGSIGWNVMVTNAPTVDKLKGYSIQLGGSAAKLVATGGEWVILPTTSSSGEMQVYHGVNVFPVRVGDYEPWPFEVHLTVEHDWVINQWNIPNEFKKLMK